MSRVAAQTDWIRRAGALTVEPEGDWTGGADSAQLLVNAQRLAVRLVVRARAVLAVSDCHGNCDDCCALAVAPGACSLLPALAAVRLPAGGRVPQLRDPVAAYLAALHDAAGAVYLCRRVQHASGDCFFTTRRGGSAAAATPDLCGRILAVAHRLPA